MLPTRASAARRHGGMTMRAFLLGLGVGTGALCRPGRRRPAGRTPLDILRERLARGAIDTREFEVRRRALSG